LRQHSLLGSLHCAVQPGSARPAHRGPPSPPKGSLSAVGALSAPGPGIHMTRNMRYISKQSGSVKRRQPCASVGLTLTPTLITIT
ncbi:hypothetical protein KUCAC02_005368, partial [Chaenocephalus aceratus]